MTDSERADDVAHTSAGEEMSHRTQEADGLRSTKRVAVEQGTFRSYKVAWGI